MDRATIMLDIESLSAAFFTQDDDGFARLCDLGNYIEAVDPRNPDRYNAAEANHTLVAAALEDAEPLTVVPAAQGGDVHVRAVFRESACLTELAEDDPLLALTEALRERGISYRMVSCATSFLRGEGVAYDRGYFDVHRFDVDINGATTLSDERFAEMAFDEEGHAVSHERLGAAVEEYFDRASLPPVPVNA